MRTLDIIVADKVYRLDLASLKDRPVQVCVDGEPLEVSIRRVEQGTSRPEQGLPALDKPCGGKPVKADIHFNHYPE